MNQTTLMGLHTQLNRLEICIMARLTHTTYSFITRGLMGAMLAGGLLLSQAALAANQLEDIEVTTLPGDQVQIKLQLAAPTAEPASFAINNPARIAVDLPATTVALPERRKTINIGAVQSLITAEAKERTRVVINLTNMVPYTTRAEGNAIYITLGTSALTASGGQQLATFGNAETTAPSAPANANRDVSRVDFRRSAEGAGRVLVRLTDPRTAVDIKKQGGQIIVDFIGASVPDSAVQRYNVTDFATPVRYFDVLQTERGTRLIIEPVPKANFEQLAYQTDNLFVVELKPLTLAEVEEKKRQEPEYTGERLTLNFQDIETRAALSIIADFTGLNIVVSDSVQGNVTLRLQN
ncbi:MAG TPA: AMIN domain-containing protein, partial [Gammaproteobacteria bacterium]|nr:AMIN domain-containing protein [Gammaproteobacteria bacterium]